MKTLFQRIENKMSEYEMSIHFGMTMCGSLTYNVNKPHEYKVIMSSRHFKILSDFEQTMVFKYATQEIFDKHIAELHEETVIKARSRSRSVFDAGIVGPGIVVMGTPPPTRHDFKRFLEYVSTRPLSGKVEPILWPDKFPTFRDTHESLNLLAPIKVQEDEINQKELRQKEKRGELFIRPKGKTGGFRTQKGNRTPKKKKRRKSN